MTRRSPTDPPVRPQRRAGLVRRSWVVLPLAMALLLGIQLGAIPWRYRRQIWRAQGVLVGFVLGYVVGRLAASEPG